MPANNKELLEELGDRFRHPDGTKFTKTEVLRCYRNITKADNLFRLRKRILEDAKDIESRADFLAYIPKVNKYIAKANAVIQETESEVQDFDLLSFYVALLLVDEIETVTNNAFLKVYDGRLTLGELFQFNGNRRISQLLKNITLN